MGKALTFMLFMWFVVSICGGVASGYTSITTTYLTADINDAVTTIPVASTTGFPDAGFIDILDERIAYSGKTANTFIGSVWSPLIRGASGTDAVAHVEEENVRSIESSMINSSLDYNLAVITDSSGVIAFVTIPLAILRLLGSFLTLPLTFIGTDLVIITYLWGILSAGVIVSIGIALVGGRRV